jgi:2-dehydropantoate 2-reductase
MHHVILGPGGIGGLMGACLAHSGEQVTMVVRPTAFASFPDRLHLESTFGTFDEPVGRGTSAPSADVLWVTVKATQLEAALRSVPESSVFRGVVPLLNGVDHVAVLRARFGQDVVIPATIAGESERIAPGRISHPSPFARLSVSSCGRGLLTGTLEQLEKIGFMYRFVDDDATLLWSKLVFLAPIALTTTAAGAPIGQVAVDPERSQQLEACVQEVCAVAMAEGAKVDPSLTLRGILSLPAGTRSSMQKDVGQGNPPELDAIAGPILRGAAQHHVPVPVTQALAALVARRSQTHA